MTENYLNFGGANAGIRITPGDVALIAGIGRHRIRINSTMSAANEAADGVTIAFTGDLLIPSLGLASGYLGRMTRTYPQHLNRDGSFSVLFDTEVTDDQIRTIEDRRSVTADGSFDLVLNLRYEGRDGDGNPCSGSGQLQPHKFARDAWLEGLRQVGYRNVQIIELEVIQQSADAELAKAIEFFKQAQSRYFSGDYREVAECLRQSINAIVGRPGEEEEELAEITKEIGDAQREAHKTKVGYSERFEIVRMALKFLADMGAHPEAGTTTRPEALAQLHMAAGLIQWYAKH
jgi:hypothetical protein